MPDDRDSSSARASPASELLRAFGNLEGTVASMAFQWRQQEETAKESRRELQNKFEEVLEKVNRLTSTLDHLQKDLSELKLEMTGKVLPSIDASNLRAAEKRGAAGLVRLLWLGLLAVVSAASYGLQHLVSWLSGGTGKP
jgi:hypothetical protein